MTLSRMTRSLERMLNAELKLELTIKGTFPRALCALVLLVLRGACCGACLVPGKW